MTICAYCKSRVFPTDRLCPACGSRVFVNLGENAPGAEARPEPQPQPWAQPQPQSWAQPWAQGPAPEPRVVYRTIHHRVYAGPVESPRNRWLALLLCLLGGAFGLHRFYVGKIGTGILYLLTGGFFLLGPLVDFFSILAGSFRDAEGLPLR